MSIFLESVNFSTYATFQFSCWSRDHFYAHFRGLYLPNACSQHLHTSKTPTCKVSSFHWYNWFSGKLFHVGCEQNSRMAPKKAKKCLFFGSGSTYTIKFRNFHDSTRPRLHFDGLPPKSRRSVVFIYKGLGVRYKYYKDVDVLVWPGDAHAQIEV